MTLLQAKDKIRTLGLYQPYCSLMLHGKIETRWVREGRKPPFPPGRYLFYSTKKPASDALVRLWSTGEGLRKINILLANDPSRHLNGYAIGIGNLIRVEPLSRYDAPLSYVDHIYGKYKETPCGPVRYIQWGLHFEDVQRIEPFLWPYGKQGVGLMSEDMIDRIRPVSIKQAG